MGLLDRARDRIETDLSDDELLAMIAEIEAEIDSRYGPTGARTVLYRGGDPLITVWRPIDEAQAVAIVEIDEAGDEVTLDAADFRVLDGGRTLERLKTGPNARATWQPLVRITATAVSDARQRDEVTIKILQLDITYRGLDKSERAGDYQAGGVASPDAFTKEREALFGSLAPRRGLQVA